MVAAFLFGLLAVVLHVTASPVSSNAYGGKLPSQCSKDELFKEISQDCNREQAINYCKSYAIKTETCDTTSTPTVIITKSITLTGRPCTQTLTATLKETHTSEVKITKTETTTKTLVSTSNEVVTVTSDLTLTGATIATTIVESPTFVTTDATVVIPETSLVPFSTTVATNIETLTVTGVQTLTVTQPETQVTYETSTFSYTITFNLIVGKRDVQISPETTAVAMATNPAVMEARDNFGKLMRSVNKSDKDHACSCLGFPERTVSETSVRTAKPTTKTVLATVQIPGRTQTVTVTRTKVIEITQSQTDTVTKTETTQETSTITTTQTDVVTHMATVQQPVTITNPVPDHRTLTQLTTVIYPVENDFTVSSTVYATTILVSTVTQTAEYTLTIPTTTTQTIRYTTTLFVF